MKYTLWHCGVLVGNADMNPNPEHSSHIAGELHPTEYGRRVLPKLSGMLTAAADLKAEMTEHGMSEESLVGEEGLERFKSLPVASRMVDIGRELSEVQLRDANGVSLEWKTLGFLDLAELAALTRRLGVARDLERDIESVDQSRVLVSATLAPSMPNRRPVLDPSLS